MKTTGFGKVVDVLKDLQSKKIINDYAVGGAVAAIFHNEPISTIDLDIFFFLANKGNSPILSLSAIYDYAKENGFYFDAEFINIAGWLVQFVEVSHNDLWIEAVKKAEPIEIDDTNILVIGREHLVAMWILAGRNKDYRKISMFVESDTLDYEKLFVILKKYDLMEKWEKEKWRFLDE